MKTKLLILWNSILVSIKKIKLSILCCLILCVAIIIFFCCSAKKTTRISDDTFIYGKTVYKIVDNEVRKITNLGSDSIRKFQVLMPIEKDYGQSSLSFIKNEAYTRLHTLYRGTILYFKLNVFGLNDLSENYTSGEFTVEFFDEYGYIIQSAIIKSNELVGQVDDNNKVKEREYNGKIEMSSDIYKAIKTYSVSSTVKEKSKSSYWDW